MEKYDNNVKNKIELIEKNVDNLNRELIFYYDEQERIKKEIERIKSSVTEYDNPNIDELNSRKNNLNRIIYISLIGAVISLFLMGGKLIMASLFITTSMVSKYKLNKIINEIDSYKNTDSRIKNKTLMRLEEKSKNIDKKINNLQSKKIYDADNNFDNEEKKYDETSKILILKKRLTK